VCRRLIANHRHRRHTGPFRSCGKQCQSKTNEVKFQNLNPRTPVPTTRARRNLTPLHATHDGRIASKRFPKRLKVRHARGARVRARRRADRGGRAASPAPIGPMGRGSRDRWTRRGVRGGARRATRKWTRGAARVMPRNTPSRTGARAWGSARACAGDGPERRRRLCDARAFSRRRVQAVAVGSRDARARRDVIHIYM
jgi:hypothetical protein